MDNPQGNHADIKLQWQGNSNCKHLMLFLCSVQKVSICIYAPIAVGNNAGPKPYYHGIHETIKSTDHHV